MIRGTKWENSMVGARFMGKAFDNFDFTLNYLFKRTDAAAFFDIASAFGENHADGLGRLDAYGRRMGSLDSELAANGLFIYDPTKGPDENGVWADKAHQNEFQRILDRCVRDGKATYLVGVDLYGFSQDGNPNNDRNDSFCFQTGHYYPWTNVFGFTLTYNDFDYTGAVFRVEQRWSTNEPRNFGPAAQAVAGGTQAHWNANLQAARDRYMNNPANEGYIQQYIDDAAQGSDDTAGRTLTPRTGSRGARPNPLHRLVGQSLCAGSGVLCRFEAGAAPHQVGQFGLAEHDWLRLDSIVGQLAGHGVDQAVAGRHRRPGDVLHVPGADDLSEQ